MSNRIIPQSEEELERDKRTLEVAEKIKNLTKGTELDYFSHFSQWVLDKYQDLEGAHIKIEKLEEENKELKEELENSIKYRIL